MKPSAFYSWWIGTVLIVCNVEGRQNESKEIDFGRSSLPATSILSALSAFQLLQMKMALLSLILAGVYVFWYKLFPDELMKMEEPNYDPSGSTFQGLL